ncbi:MAG: class I SAM-dependent methyltransferase [Bacteroidales bacterium]|nr:class I SAM-dependent methyltransferase [Bacteroidales bacterium]
MVHHTNCPLCSSGDLNFHLTCRDHFLTGEPFDLYKCGSCNFVFTQDHPGEKEAVLYYDSSDYISHDASAKGFTTALYRLARRIMLARKRRLIIRLTGRTTGDLLDIGAGSGHFAGAMKEAGWNVTGIEPVKKAADYASSQFGIRMLDPAQIGHLPDRSFDCVTLWHVLEHLHDPFTYASEILRVLRPGGKCIIALPDSLSYDAGYYREHWAAYDVPRHLWHFTPGTFSFFAERAGFSLMATEDLPFDVFYISFLSEKYRGTNLPLITGVINGLRFYLAALFRRKGASSLMYILKSKAD